MLTKDDAATAAAALRDVCEAASADYADGDITDEEDFTGQLIGGLKQRLRGLETPHARWSAGADIVPDGANPLIPTVRLKARQLSKHSEEALVGADLVLALHVSGPRTDVRKGLLAQAKRLEPGMNLSKADFARLKAQSARMLDLSPSSFVFLYSKLGVGVVSAAAIEGTASPNLWELVDYGPGVMFFDFFRCWVGDPRLQATDKTSLAQLRGLARARNALIIRADIREDAPPFE